MLICHADPSPLYVADVKSKLEDTGLVGSVDVFNCSAATPTLAYLHNYTGVLVWSYVRFFDRFVLGDILVCDFDSLSYPTTVRLTFC